jgi:hypothetical protein
MRLKYGFLVVGKEMILSMVVYTVVFIQHHLLGWLNDECNHSRMPPIPKDLDAVVIAQRLSCTATSATKEKLNTVTASPLKIPIGYFGGFETMFL